MSACVDVLELVKGFEALLYVGECAGVVEDGFGFLVG